MSKIRRTLSRSLKLSSKKERPNLDTAKESSLSIAGANFAAAFWGEAGFEQLRKSVHESNDLFKEVMDIFHERTELETIYAKTLQKLAARLVKASRNAHGTIDGSWKFVADSLEGESVVHNNLGLALKEEIIDPLKTVYDAQQKTKKYVDSTVDKALKRLEEKRSEQIKMKKQVYSLSKELEKVERTCTEEVRRAVRTKTEKQLAKLQSKRFKICENVLKYEHEYKSAAIDAEYQRSELEVTLANSSDRLEALEQQRLAHFQTTIGRYQRRMVQVGPALTQACNRNLRDLDRAITADVYTDLCTMTAECQPKQLAYRTLVLCDFYAEDFSQVLSAERRKEALERQMLMFQKEIEKEIKGKQGLEYLSNAYERSQSTDASKLTVKDRLKDCRTALNFLDYHLYKTHVALSSVDRRITSKPSHPLAKYEERNKDKVGLRQTILRVPLYAGDELIAPPSAVHELPVVVPQCRGKADGESPANSPKPCSEEATTSEPIYEPIEPNEDDEYEFDDGPETAENVSITDSLIYQAIFDFEPQRQDELKLKAGDTIKIIDKVSDNWWQGFIMDSGQTGLIPTNYIQIKQ